MIASVVPYGAGAVFVDLGIDAAPDRAARTLALAEALREAFPAADVVLGAGIDEVRRIASAPTRAAPRALPRTHTIAAAYDGPDLADVAQTVGLAIDEAIARHAATEHVVELLGFLPGFAYLAAPSGAPLAVPRRASPRPKIPARSVAVAASFSGIYPFASPGGWNLIARAIDTWPFDASRDQAVLFAPGDRVRFSPVEGPLADARGSGPLADARGSTSRGSEGTRGLAIVRAPACATVQDRGRRGQLGRGIPPSGPLDPELARAANVAVGNDEGAAVIEIPLGSIEVEARGARLVVSIDGEPQIALSEGERLCVPSNDRAVRVLAVRGGIDVPRVLGARATLIAASLGGHLGRPLRRGDVLGVGDEIASSSEHVGSIGDLGPLEIDPGPHVHRFPRGAYEALLSAAWVVSRLGDRVGVRLEGARVPREGPDLALPVPMIRGAVEVTTDGTPIVLGPDHPTTGGYPVIAVLRERAQAALARRKPGSEVRFVEGR